MAYLEDDVLAKTGVELFRELFRVYPVADPEDYFKNNMWKDDFMKMDLKLIYAHAREAGAPYPKPLKEVKLPEMSPAMKVAAGGAQQLMNGVRPVGVQLPGGVRPAATPLTAPGAATAAATTGGPAAELRLIALFVAKWKLDPTKTKILLAKLTPERRRYAIQHFKGATAGAEATAALEQFIQQCETTNAWAGATVPAVAGMPATAPAMAAGALTPGLKRPLATSALDAAKRPRLMVPAVAAAKTVAPLRPATAGMVRPPTFGAPRAMTVTPPPRPNMMMPKAGGVQQGGLIRGLLNRF